MIHNPKVGGSIPLPVTSILNQIKDLEETENRDHESCCSFSSKTSPHSIPNIQKYSDFSRIFAPFLQYLGALTPRSSSEILDSCFMLPFKV